MATLKDIAALAGVSVASVSLYLNKKADGRVSAENQKKIENALTEMHYTASRSMRILKSISTDRKNFTVALFWAQDARANMLGIVIDGMNNARKKNPDVNISIVIHPYTVNELYKDTSLIENTPYDCAIIANASYTDLQYLEDINPTVPIVLLNRNSNRYNTAKYENHKAGKTVADILQRCGYRSAAVIQAYNSYTAVNARVSGFISACRDNHIDIPNKAHIFTEGSVEGGMSAAEKFLALDERPKVILFGDDRLAFGALHTFYKNQVKIPKEVAIISMCMLNPVYTSCSCPSLTILELPMTELSEACMQIAIDVLQGKAQPVHTKVKQPEMVYRDSFPDMFDPVEVPEN